MIAYTYNDIIIFRDTNLRVLPMIYLDEKKISLFLKKKINLKNDFEKNNLDSLDKLLLIDYLAKNYKVKISLNKIAKINNFEDLKKLI